MRKTTHHRSEIDSYQLIDFGQGRKLESFGGRLFDRPCPAAEGERKRNSQLWRHADSFFDAGQRQWTHHTPLQSAIEVVFDRFRMPISPTPFGHLGVFPEQAPNWRWLRTTAPDPALVGPQSTTTDAIVRDDAVPQKGLNLFGYTGASSIAMAVSGLAVAHVDAAKQNVSSARSAARINGLAEHPIRYLVDDAVKFVAREVRRGNRYHTIVMDPPAYGHSPSGKAWRLERDLWPLIDNCLSLLTREDFRLLITGHSPQVQAADVVNYLESQIHQTLGLSPTQSDLKMQSDRLTLIDPAKRRLDAGFYVRCCHQSH